MARSSGRLIAVVAGAGVLVVLALLALDWQTIAASWRFWRLFESIGRNEQGLPEYRHRQTGIVMVRVPGRTFMMGSPEDEAGRFVDELRHEVTLSPFLIGKFEVTQAIWEQVMGSNPSKFKGESLPMERVSWNECKEFLSKVGLEFPTEAQWEYACRAGTTGPYSGTGVLEEMGWHEGNSGDTTHPVGEKKPNGFGLHDMHGNVEEWCEDVSDREFYSKAMQEDPVCKSGSGFRVVRGGGYYSNARVCRSADRGGVRPSGRYDFIGFRVAYYPLP